jgi:aminoglycoside phosphotransferase (APT) family kinase protein
MYWGDAANTGRPSRPGDNASTTVISLPGFPAWDEAKARYASKSGRNVDDLDFYIVLAHFKLAVIVEGIRERFEKGGTVGEGFEGMAARATALARSGLNVADRSNVPALRG